MNAPDNLFTVPAGALEEECFDTLLQGKGLRLERILSTGQVTPEGQWYDQESDEWVALLQGEAKLEFDDGSRLRLAAGDHCFIPARRRHRVASTSTSPACVWLALHLPAEMAGPVDPDEDLP